MCKSIKDLHVKKLHIIVKMEKILFDEMGELSNKGYELWNNGKTIYSDAMNETRICEYEDTKILIFATSNGCGIDYSFRVEGQQEEL